MAIDVLLVLGTALVLLSSLGVLLAREPFDQLHFLAPASTLGAPLICIAVMLQLGLQRTTAKVAVIGIVLMLVQPAVTAATGRALAAGRGLVSAEDDS
ncbi:MAG TPA: monovalent cation/H(+) antiporter subunit G [Mycobacteriales bacterium]|nr:monovalent cation/H(+) antiporter subunit G [Mycobacteriales bacterium]